MKNGEEFISILCDRLKTEERLCTDGNIVNLLRSLDKYQVNQICVFGDTPTWHNDKCN